MFDALEPVQDVFTTPQNARVLGVYLRWSTRHMPSGTFRGELAVVGECEEVIIPVTLTVVDICAPAVETFRLTNWFSLENMAKYHEVPLWSEAHWEQIAEYKCDICGKRIFGFHPPWLFQKCMQTVIGALISVAANG